jgi:hypothetical protein
VKYFTKGLVTAARGIQFSGSARLPRPASPVPLSMIAFAGR